MSMMRDQVTNLFIKFSHYKDQWENRFQDLEDAYDKGYEEFTKHLPKAHKHMPKDVAEDIGEMGANMFVAGMAYSGTAAVIAVPIVLGVKKLAGFIFGDADASPRPDVSAARTRLKDIKRAFRQATEHLSAQITKLHDRAITLAGNQNSINDADFRGIKQTISKLLLSPLWYPPSPKATDPAVMARPFEMRMWFSYWKHLARGDNIELYRMFRRLKELHWQPPGHNWDRVNNTISTDIGKKRESTPYGEWETAYKPAIKYLVGYSQQFIPLRIQHRFPREVEEYLKRSSSLGVRASNTPAIEDSLLSPATMTWVDVSAWKP
jgi:hypothetical protein